MRFFIIIIILSITGLSHAEENETKAYQAIQKAEETAPMLHDIGIINLPYDEYAARLEKMKDFLNNYPNSAHTEQLKDLYYLLAYRLIMGGMDGTPLCDVNCLGTGCDKPDDERLRAMQKVAEFDENYAPVVLEIVNYLTENNLCNNEVWLEWDKKYAKLFGREFIFK